MANLPIWIATGKLGEDRHGWPVGATRGRLTSIRWRPHRTPTISKDGRPIGGYGPVAEMDSTEDRLPAAADGWSFELTVWVNE